MSTTATTITQGTPTAPHPAWYARAGTWFLKIGREVKTAVLKLAGASAGIQAEVAKIAPSVEAVSEMVLPGSSTFEQHLLDVWGAVANGVKDAGAAAGASGLSITLDAQLVSDVKALLPMVEKYLHRSASPAPPTQ